MKRWLVAVALLAACSTPAPAFRDPRPVFVVHGFDGHGSYACANLEPLLKALGPTAVSIGTYAADRGCGTPGLPGVTVQTSIEDIARQVAALALARPGPVDLVGHSMGALIVAEVRQDLPAGKVAHVITLGGPFVDLPSAHGCATTQCHEMDASSPQHLHVDTSGLVCIGSTADEIVPISSSLPGCPREITVTRLHHGQLLSDPSVARTVQGLLRS